MSEEALRSTEMMMRLASPMFRGATQGIGGLATAGVIGTLGITYLAGKAITAPFKAIASLVRYANEHPELLEKRGEITMKKLVAQETTGIHTTRLLESKELEALKAKLEYYGVAFTVEHTEHGAYIHLEAKDLPRLEHALEAVQPEIMRMEIRELDAHITDLAATIQAEEKVIGELDKEIAQRTEEIGAIDKDISQLSQQEGNERAVEALREKQTGLSDEVKELRDERIERQERAEEMKTERADLVQEKTELENSLKEQLKQERAVEPPVQDREVSETVNQAKEAPENTQSAPHEDGLAGHEVETQETVVSETVSTSNDVPEPMDEMKTERSQLAQEKTELENSLKEQVKQERVVEPPTQEKELGETIEKAQETPKNTQEMLSENEVETQETVVSETVSTSNDVPEPTQDITLDGNLTGQDVPTQHAPGTQKTTTTTTRNNRGQQKSKRTETKQERAARKRDAAYKLDPERAAAAKQAPTPTTPNAKLSR